MATWDRIGAKSTGELPPLVWNWLKTLFAYMEGGVLKVNGTPVNFGNSLPNGGTTGQTLSKQSNADGDATWQTSLAVTKGSAMNPHTTKAAVRNSSFAVNFWQYTGVIGVDDPTNWQAGDRWINV
jgi:hypothetical protein